MASVLLLVACTFSPAPPPEAAGLLDLASVARWPEPAFEATLHSSADPDPTPFANEDRGHVLRNDGGWRVLVDEDGPGAVTRMWIANAQRAGKMRIWLDDRLVFDDVATDGFTLGAPTWGGRTGGAWSSWLPLAYARHVKIAVSDNPGRGLYWQIDTLRWPPGTPVIPWDGSVGPLPAAPPPPQELGAGEELVFTEPGAITRLDWEGDVPPDARIEAWFDGVLTVDAPLGAFFARPVGRRPGADLVHTVTADTLTSRWVMPWASTASLRVRGGGAGQLRAWGGPWTWDDRSMHFHAAVRQDRRPTRPKTLLQIARIAARGVWVGETLWIDNPSARWWGEGDELGRVDGRLTHAGTGTEDWHGYAYCAVEPFDAPFGGLSWADAAGTPGEPCEHNRGRAASTRVRLADRIPFSRSFDLDLEVWHKDDTTLELAVLGRWYQL